MHRKAVSFPFPESDLQNIKNKMLNWLKPFSIFAYLDNNGYGHKPARFELLLAASPVSSAATAVQDEDGDWRFGHFAYDYKNQVEPSLSSRHPDFTGFADSAFYRPDVVMYIHRGTHTLHVTSLLQDPQHLLEQVLQAPAVIPAAPAAMPPRWQYDFDEQDYMATVQQIKAHIAAGDCYEMNFCTRAFAEDCTVEPFALFHRLNVLNPAPFAALYRNGASWLICASPERFLYREGARLLSQPIKGTARRAQVAGDDERLKAALLHDPKERAENVMIVDLVRNDLARSCEPGSVSVPELFGVYTFPQVHQLISTVEGRLKPGTGNQEAIAHAFPMGSMTGAPKIMVMRLTEQYERARRGLYAGCIGYIAPGGDFDFNVVIRSLQYNATSSFLSYQTGGAITYDSDPAAEWAEVRLKAKALEQVFL